MANSIAAQLQAIRATLKVNSEPLKRPFTRPSILFDPKEAADIDIESILTIALSGLEVLIGIDERFGKYKNDLFSPNSRELDRELMGIEENNQINASVNSYLRLLSGHFQLPPALKTIEYLIRRYKIHVYNMEELILCALPYHDTHIFVRIVQLLDTGNSKWKFLDGVKLSGAPPPRTVFVQQCIRDMGVLEVLCSYASPTKKLQASRPVISFCTAVTVEVLGSLKVVDTDVVKRIIPYVLSGLQSHREGSLDHKAGALMIVGLLANKSELSPNLVKSLIRSIAKVACEDAKESTDLQLFRMSFMALINVVQLQSLEVLPKKVLDSLKEIRDLSGILAGLTKEFNIDKFLALLSESLLEYSPDDELCHQALLSLIETVPMKGIVGRLVSKVLSTCIRLNKKSNESSPFESGGSQANQVLASINKLYPLELRRAFQRFLEGSKEKFKGENSVDKILCKTLDGNLGSSVQPLGSQIWFGLEHPQAEVRRATILSIDVGGSLGDRAVDSQDLVIVKDALLRRLRDDDLVVVQAALNLRRLSEYISSPCLLGELQDVLRRCIEILLSGMTGSISLASDVAVSCLEHAISSLGGHNEYTRDVAAMFFPLILIVSKMQKLNLKALDLVKEVEWPLYRLLSGITSSEKKLDRKEISSVNMDNISRLAEGFLTYSDECLRWFVESCHELELSKTIFFLIMLQSFMLVAQRDFSQFSALYESCFPVIRSEWEKLELSGFEIAAEESKKRMLDQECTAFIDQVYDTTSEEMNADILICLFWRILEAFTTTLPEDVSMDENKKWILIPQDLFVFFASRSKNVFKKHLHYLVATCKHSPARFLSKFFTDEGVSSAVQVESLHSFAFLCSQTDEDLFLQLLAEFPSILVPLSSNDQNTRTAAMNCIEGLSALWPRVNSSRLKNGRSVAWSNFLGELLGLMVQQKRLILSDRDILPDFFATLLSSSHRSLLLPPIFGERFDQTSKDGILGFILGYALHLSPYGMLEILSLFKGIGSKLLLVKEVEALLRELVKRRYHFHLGHEKSSHKLSKVEVQVLCLLLECCATPTSSTDIRFLEDYILKALQVDGMYSEDPCIIQPCTTVLKNLSNTFYRNLKPEEQEFLFQELVLLFRSCNGDVQNAARDALLRIDIDCSTVQRMIHKILEKDGFMIGSTYGKKKKKAVTHLNDLHLDVGKRCGSKLSFLSSLLDALLLKKDIQNRTSLLGPLFDLLSVIFMDNEWISKAVNNDEKYMEASSGVSITMCYVQQNLLLVVEAITKTLTPHDGKKDDVVNKYDLELLVKCARSASDPTTRNHVFSLLSATAKVIPDQVLDHILDILTVIGESAVTQLDSRSQNVFEDLISSLVPCWLSKTDNPEQLLQIFVDILPEVAEHRRLSIIVHLLRTLGESCSLNSLLSLLFRSLASKKGLCDLEGNGLENNRSSLDSLSSIVRAQWEYVFALQISEQYSCMIWLPSLVALLEKSTVTSEQQFIELLIAVQFIADKFQDPEVAFKFQSGEDMDNIQATAGALMEQVVSHLQLFDSKRKKIGVPFSLGKELKDLMDTVLRFITKGLLPSTYFKVTYILLGHSDKNVRRKALGLLCETTKDSSIVNQKRDKKGFNPSVRGSWLHFDEHTSECFTTMCLEILKLVDDSVSSISLKLAAVSTLEALVLRFTSNDSIFNQCLASVVKNIQTDDFTFSSGCLRTTGALVNVLGPRALPELPNIMGHVLKKFRDECSPVHADSRCHVDNSSEELSNSKESLFMSILITVEAVIDKLGGFLNPYLGDILELLILQPYYATDSSSKLKLKADGVRKLITVKIPVRLSLPPLLKIYSEALRFGDSGISSTFEMLGNLIGSMDKSSVSGYYIRIFDLCLLALDLRRQHPASVKNIDVVERHVINTVIVLTMKLTENRFKPLFIKSVEWSESSAEDNEDTGRIHIDRAISFYGLVNKLVESHRSLFVPYFKFLLDGLVRHLTDGGHVHSGPSRKKKAKLSEQNFDKNNGDGPLSIEKWHLRSLVLSSLQKCFLYDTGSPKFLEASNFQVLLKPITSQLGIEPPISLEQHPNIHSVNAFDDLLVACVGQMAVASGSDTLWKPLNHEVLMQTRSESVRTRILGLRIVKFFVENLRDEYLAFIPETIPFLGELLEDVEPPVKSLAQEVLKLLQTLSGDDDLRQYL